MSSASSSSPYQQFKATIKIVFFFGGNPKRRRDDDVSLPLPLFPPRHSNNLLLPCSVCFCVCEKNAAARDPHFTFSEEGFWKVSGEPKGGE